MRIALIFAAALPLLGQTFKTAVPFDDHRTSGAAAPFPSKATPGDLPTTDASVCATPGAYFDVITPASLYRNSGVGGTCSWSVVTGSGDTVSSGTGISIVHTTGNNQILTSPEVPLNTNLQGSASPIVCIDTSSSTTAYTPACGAALTAYAAKQTFTTFFVTPNTTATPTANFDTLGAKTITCGDGNALLIGVLKAGYPYTTTYDGTNIRVNACAEPNDIKAFAYEVGSENASAAFSTADLTNHSILINDTKAKTLTEASCVTDAGSQTITVKIGGTTLFTITCVANGSYSRSTTNGTTGYIVAASMTTIAIAAGTQVDMSGTANGTTKDIKLHAWGTVN